MFGVVNSTRVTEEMLTKASEWLKGDEKMEPEQRVSESSQNSIAQRQRMLIQNTEDANSRGRRTYPTNRATCLLHSRRVISTIQASGSLCSKGRQTHPVIPIGDGERIIDINTSKNNNGESRVRSTAIVQTRKSFAKRIFPPPKLAASSYDTLSRLCYRKHLCGIQPGACIIIKSRVHLMDGHIPGSRC
ncbi:hypothetical protein HPP92_028910 [Vanilla planifolia]|uniref:Uncharacterized protein n=1 Tax=Vanilla planifolia TaxID=51239 RepID=A0A835P7G0_VANPL|nr:hypothetical protein HPP92_028910 [Vanilla planifolia]KAG0446313.1 hypothetical protein HPP92_028900 [Vanilla planifolia]